MEYTIVVVRLRLRSGPAAVHRARTPAAPSPSTSCTRKGSATLCVYDDLSKQAAAYRQLSLILRAAAGPRGVSGRRVLPAQPPARARREDLENADVVKLDARIKKPGGSLTALPDHRDPGRRRLGVHPDQRHLDHRRPDLPRRPTCSTPNVRPAVDAGISVSRVGGNAADQGDEAGRRPAAARRWRSTASCEAFAQFGSELDAATQRQLARGARAGRGAQAAAVRAGPGRARRWRSSTPSPTAHLDDVEVEAHPAVGVPTS